MSRLRIAYQTITQERGRVCELLLRARRQEDIHAARRERYLPDKAGEWP